METVDDIIADIRQRATVACGQDADATVHHNAIGDMLVDIADRIEAAWKRERSMVEQDALETGAFVSEARRPRRNCDRFATGENWKALSSFDAFCDCHTCDNCPIGESGGPFGLCIVAWMLALYEEGAE